MSFGILNNISALNAENALNSTRSTLESTLQQLSTGMRINSGSDDPAGLAIANGLSANVSVIDTESLKVVATIPAAKGAWGVAVSPE